MSFGNCSNDNQGGIVLAVNTFSEILWYTLMKKVKRKTHLRCGDSVKPVVCLIRSLVLL